VSADHGAHSDSGDAEKNVSENSARPAKGYGCDSGGDRMNAVISGQAGIALLLDGEEISSLHAGRPGQAVLRSPGEVSLLFGEAKDLQFLEETDVEEVSGWLERASDEVDALHLALILLDE